MIKIIGILIIGIISGAIITTGVSAFIFHNLFWQSTKTQEQSTQIAQAPGVKPPTPTTPPVQNTTQQYNEKVDNLKNRLYQQGLNITSKVFQNYPGIGFILQDSTGTKLFAYWTGTSPQVGQNVSVLGTIGKVTDDLSKIKTSSGYTQDLDTFLKNQTVYIQVKEIK